MSPSNPSLSLCMIVKNESHIIRQCLGEVADLTDEIIIIDTGSTDDTIKLCKDFTDQIYPFTWNNNFSDARNFSLSKAQSDWILVLDADEILKHEDLNKILTKLTKTPENVWGFYFTRINYTEKNDFDSNWEDFVVRLFRNRKEIYFEGKVHEWVDDSIIANSKITQPVPAGINLYHYGFKKGENYLKKSDEYKNILLKEIERGNDKYNSYLKLAYEYEKQKKYDKEFDCLKKAIGINPKYILPYIRAGLVLGGHLKNIKKSIDYFNNAEKLINKNTKQNNLLKRHDIFSLWLNISKNYFYLDNYDKAVTYFERAFSIIKNNPDLLHYAAILYDKKGEIKRSIYFQNKLCGSNPDEKNFLQLAKYYIKINDFKNGIKNLNKTLEYNPNNELASNLLSKLIKIQPMKKGFTIIEVLIAIVIIGFTLITISGGINNSIKIINQFKYEKSANLLADDILKQIDIADNINTFNKKGEWEYQNIIYKWTIKIEKFPIDKIFPDQTETANLSIELNNIILNITYSYYNEQKTISYNKIIP